MDGQPWKVPGLQAVCRLAWALSLRVLSQLPQGSGKDCVSRLSIKNGILILKYQFSKRIAISCYLCVLCSPGWVHWGRWGPCWSGSPGRCVLVYEGGHDGMWLFCSGRVLHPPPPFTHHRLSGTYAHEGKRCSWCLGLICIIWPTAFFFIYLFMFLVSSGEAAS